MEDGGGEHRAPAENAGAAAETNICLANTINLYGGEGTLPDRLSRSECQSRGGVTITLLHEDALASCRFEKSPTACVCAEHAAVYIKRIKEVGCSRCERRVDTSVLPQGKGDDDLPLLCLECVVNTGMKNITVRKSYTGTPKPKQDTARDQAPAELETMKNFVAEYKVSEMTRLESSITDVVRAIEGLANRLESVEERLEGRAPPPPAREPEPERVARENPARTENGWEEPETWALPQLGPDGFLKPPPFGSVYRPEGFKDGDPLGGRWLVVESVMDRTTGIYRLDDAPVDHERIAMAASYDAACDILAGILQSFRPIEANQPVGVTAGREEIRSLLGERERGQEAVRRSKDREPGSVSRATDLMRVLEHSGAEPVEEPEAERSDTEGREITATTRPPSPDRRESSATPERDRELYRSTRRGPPSQHEAGRESPSAESGSRASPASDRSSPAGSTRFTTKRFYTLPHDRRTVFEGYSDALRLKSKGLRAIGREHLLQAVSDLGPDQLELVTVVNQTGLETPLVNHAEFRSATRDRFGALGFGAAGDTLSREELANILAELLRRQEEVQSSHLNRFSEALTNMTRVQREFNQSAVQFNTENLKLARAKGVADQEKLLGFAFTRRTEQQFFMATDCGRDEDLPFNTNLYGVEAWKQIQVMSEGDLWERCQLRTLLTDRIVVLLLGMRLGNLSGPKLELTMTPMVNASAVRIRGPLQGESLSAVLKQKYKTAVESGFSASQVLEHMDAAISVLVAFYGRRHQQGLDACRRFIANRHYENDVVYDVRWMEETWHKLLRTFVTTGLEAYLTDLGVTESWTDNDLLTAVETTEGVIPTLDWDYFPNTLKEIRTLEQVRRDQALDRLVRMDRHKPGSRFSGPEDLDPSGLKERMAAEQKRGDDERGRAAGTAPPPEPPGGPPGAGQGGYPPRDPARHLSPREQVAKKEFLRSKGEPFFKAAAGPQGANMYTCLKCLCHEQCDMREGVVHSTPPFSASDRKACPVLDIEAVMYGDWKTSPMIKRGARAPRIEELRKKAQEIMEKRYAGAFGLPEGTVKVKVNPQLAHYPQALLETEGELAALKKVEEEKDKATVWENEVKASPSHKRWSGFTANSESLQKREAMRGIDSTRVLKPLSAALHLIVANMVLDALYVSPGSDEMRDIDIDAEWVASAGADALGKVAAGKDVAKREEARKLLSAPPFRKHRGVSWATGGPEGERAAGGGPLEYVRVKDGQHGGQLGLPGGLAGRYIDGGQTLINREGPLRHKACMLTATGNALRATGIPEFQLSDRSVAERATAAAEELAAALPELRPGDMLGGTEALVRRTVHDNLPREWGGVHHDNDLRLAVVLTHPVHFPEPAQCDIMAVHGCHKERIITSAMLSTGTAEPASGRRPLIFYFFEDNHATAFVVDAARSEPTGPWGALSTTSERREYVRHLAAAGAHVRELETLGGAEMMRAARAAEEPVGPAGKMLKCLCCPHFDGLSDAAKPEPRFAGPPGGAPLAPEAVPEEERLGRLWHRAAGHPGGAVGGWLSFPVPGLTWSSIETREKPVEAMGEVPDDLWKTACGQDPVDEWRAGEGAGYESNYVDEVEAESWTSTADPTGPKKGTPEWAAMEGAKELERARKRDENALPAPLGSPALHLKGMELLANPRVRTIVDHLVAIQVKAPEAPSVDWLQAAMRACSTLVRACGSLEAATNVHRTAWGELVGHSMDLERMDNLTDFVPPGEMHWCQVVAARGADLQWRKGQRRRRKAKEPSCEDPTKFHLVWKGIWGDFIEGRSFLLPRSDAMLIEDPDRWAIPRAGLLESTNRFHIPGDGGICSLVPEDASSLESTLDESKVFEHKLVAVDKRDEHGRVLEDKIRVVHHQSEPLTSERSRAPTKAESVNGGTSKWWFPSVVLPTMATLIIQLTAIGLMYPYARIKMAVKDVDAAFRRIPVRARDVPLMATVAGGVIVVNLVLTFGFRGSPGIFHQCGSKPLTDFHTSHCYQEPQWNGDSGMFSAAFVDDSALIAPDYGLALAMSEDCFLHGLWAMFGPKGLNVAKDAKVGPWKSVQQCWGLTYDLVKKTVGMSLVRLKRARVTLEKDTWAWGNTDIDMRELQSLHGSTRWYGQANRCLHSVQANISRLLSTADPTGRKVQPHGTPSMKRWAWVEFWDTLELHRVMLHDEELFQTSYLSTFLGAIPPDRRMSLPSEAEKIVFLGGDATPDMLFGINWKTKRAFYYPWTTAAQLAMEANLKEVGVPLGEIPEMIISIQELTWAIVAFAESCQAGTNNTLHIAVIDNSNADSWIKKRKPKNLYAAHLIKVLARLEHLSKNELHSVWVSSGHNKVPDDGSRIVHLDNRENVKGHAELVRYLATVDPAIQLISVQHLFNHYLLSSWANRSYRLHFESKECYAEKLAQERTARPPSVLNLDNTGWIELCAGCGQLTASAVARGATPVYVADSCETARWLLKRRFRGTRVMVLGSLELTNFWSLPRARRALVEAGAAGFPCVAFSRAGNQRGSWDPRAWIGYWAIKEVLVCFPNLKTFLLEQVVEITTVEGGYMFHMMEAAFKELGFELSTFVVLGSEHGDGQARTRLVVLAEAKELLEAVGPVDPPRASSKRPRTAADFMFSGKDVPRHLIIEGVFRSAVGQDRGPQYPLRVGFLNSPIFGPSCPVYTRHRAAATVKASGEAPQYSGGALYLDETLATESEPGGRVRRLDPRECWRAQNIPETLLDEWIKASEKGGSEVPKPSEVAIARVAGNAVTGGSAEALVQLQLSRLESYKKITAPPEDHQVRAAGSEWVSPEAPEPVQEAWPEWDESEWRAGGTAHIQVAASDLSMWIQENVPIWVLQENPKVKKSRVRYERYKRATTTGEYLALGGTKGDLRHDMERGYVRLAHAAQAESTRRKTEAWRRQSLAELEARPKGKGAGQEPQPLTSPSQVGEAASSKGPLPPPPAEAEGEQEFTPRLLFDRIHGTSYEVDADRCQFSKSVLDRIANGRLRFITASLAGSSQRKYAGNFRRFESWVAQRGATLGPILDGSQPLQEEDLLMDFIVYQVEVRGLKHSTISGYMSAIRWVHLANGFDDPTANKPRLRMARRAIKRLTGEVKGKLPVTPDMLKHIGSNLAMDEAKHAVTWAGLNLAFFFLLRSAEYCDDPIKALQVGDVQFFKEGEPTDDLEQADELVIFIRSSKTDQTRKGARRNAYKTGSLLCPVVAAAKVMRLRQSMGAADDDPFLAYGHKQMLTRKTVTEVLRWAARDLGQVEANFASHSLRIGGASTMLACGYSEEYIRRQGRWQSYCWRQYAYDNREQMAGVSTAMATSDYTVMSAGQDFVHRRRGVG